MHNISTDAIIVLAISNNMIKHEAGSNIFCQVSIKQLICVAINKVTHTSVTKTGFAFSSKNQCIQHGIGMCKGQCKKTSFEYKLQSLFFLRMTKYHAKSFNKIGFSKKKVSRLAQTKEKILAYVMKEIYQYVQICGCLEALFHNILSRPEASENKDIIHDDVTYPVYRKNYKTCVILGKSSKHVRFIFVSYVYDKRLTYL